MKLHPDDILKEFDEGFAGALLDPALIKAAQAFEEKWTEKGVPENDRMRYALGLGAGYLEAKGCPRELLHEFIDAILDEKARLMGK